MEIGGLPPAALIFGGVYLIAQTVDLWSWKMILGTLFVLGGIILQIYYLKTK